MLLAKQTFKPSKVGSPLPAYQTPIPMSYIKHTKSHNPLTPKTHRNNRGKSRCRAGIPDHRSNKIWWWASILGHVDPIWIYYSKSNLIQNMCILSKENLRTNSILMVMGLVWGILWTFMASRVTVDPSASAESGPSSLNSSRGIHEAKTGHPKWGVTNGLNGVLPLPNGRIS